MSELVDRVDALERRLAALEGAGPAARADVPAAPEGTWWLLDALAARHGDGGAVAFGGRVPGPEGGEVTWQVEHPAGGVLDVDPEAAAHALAALGHPVRLRLLVALVRGARTLGDLAELPGMGTSGQLHHHLRELRSAGWVVQPRRSHYAVAADHVVPLLVALAAAVGPDRVPAPDVPPITPTQGAPACTSAP